MPTAPAATSTEGPFHPMAGYWLFKTEPAEYGIDHLAAESDATVRWDGIRNYQARNHLRDRVAKGDRVFIYHSSCKVPGIAGTARVVSDPYPDPTQFDPDSPYHDPRSQPHKPRWYAVDIRHQRTFEALIPAAHLRQVAALEGMVLFHQGRLSIQPVSRDHWQVIMDLADGKAKQHHHNNHKPRG